eukprot:tig00001501_g9225.t1
MMPDVHDGEILPVLDLRKTGTGALTGLVRIAIEAGPADGGDPLPFGARGARLDPAAEREGDEADCPICLESFSRELPPIVIPAGTRCAWSACGGWWPLVGAERLTCSVLPALFTSDELHVHGPGARSPPGPRSPSPAPAPPTPTRPRAPPAAGARRRAAGCPPAAPDAAALEGPSGLPEAPRRRRRRRPSPGASRRAAQRRRPEEGEARGPKALPSRGCPSPPPIDLPPSRLQLL